MTREFKEASIQLSVAERPAVAIAEKLASEISNAADEIDRLRRLPDDLVSSLKAAGAFRLLIPGEFSGLGVELPDFVDAVSCGKAWKPC